MLSEVVNCYTQYSNPKPKPAALNPRSYIPLVNDGEQFTSNLHAFNKTPLHQSYVTDIHPK
jgi:hypothetical protein